MLGDDEGSVTIEAAVAMGALVVVTSLIVGALATLASYIHAVDMAGAAARSYAVGQRFHPTRGTVEVSISNGWVTVRSSVPAPLGDMGATAVFPVEVAAGAQQGGQLGRPLGGQLSEGAQAGSDAGQ